MPIELCLFDLDDTLLRTSDLERFRGQANVGRGLDDLAYQVELVMALGDVAERMIYSWDALVALRARHPNIKWGVFTRSPRAYAHTLLATVYPRLKWDVVIAREDVRQTKPYKDGVWHAMDFCGVDTLDKVALVGDNKVDVQTAYQSGCWSVLDQSSWPRPWPSECYYAIEKVPDAVIGSPAQLDDVLATPQGYLAELEYMVSTRPRIARATPRFVKLNHFFPRPDPGRLAITVMGRMFGEYELLQPRRQWHTLTEQIHQSKDATEFPDAWIEAIRSYLSRENWGGSLVTVIPFKPGRTPRLEYLLDQLRRSHEEAPIRDPWPFHFVPDLLAFDPGAVSSHGQHLSREQRFDNVGQHLRVARPGAVRGQRIVVIDDVTTSGASLLWAHRYLMQAGARAVSCLSLTKAVGIG